MLDELINKKSDKINWSDKISDSETSLLVSGCLWFGVKVISPPPLPLSAPSELITDNQIEIGQLKADLKDKVMYTLLRKHRHQTKKSNLRSLADIGKTVSSASRLFSNQENGNTDASLVQSSSFVKQWKENDSVINVAVQYLPASLGLIKWGAEVCSERWRTHCCPPLHERTTVTRSSPKQAPASLQ